MDLLKNGTGPAPQMQAVVTTSWVRDDYASGRKRFTLYALHVPTVQAEPYGARIDTTHPRLAGAPTVIGQVTIEVPNLEVAKILVAGLNEMLSKQPPEILQMKAGGL